MSGRTFVDSSVLLDVISGDSRWVAWSGQQLSVWADQSQLVINAIVYAEISVRVSSREALEHALVDVTKEDLPYDAAFLAGKVHAEYRRRGGLRTSLLPDFLIGAHASVRGYRLLTRDPKRFLNAFPALRLIAPNLG